MNREEGAQSPSVRRSTTPPGANARNVKNAAERNISRAEMPRQIVECSVRRFHRRRRHATPAFAHVEPACSKKA